MHKKKKKKKMKKMNARLSLLFMVFKMVFFPVLFLTYNGKSHGI